MHISEVCCLNMPKLGIVVVLTAAFTYYVTFAPPNKFLIDIEPIAYSTSLFESFDGPLKHNTILSNAERLLDNQIDGPESLAIWNDEIYTGTFGGQVVRIKGTKIIPIAKISNGGCDVPWNVKCGRPLGLRFNSKGTLYVVDAYHGLYKIESCTTSTPIVTQLLPLSATKNLKGGTSVFFDDITIAEGADGDVIYISDVSTKWDLSMLVNSLIEHDKTGRLLKFIVSSRELSVVGENFAFPNGVQITDDKEAVIVCELGEQRLIRTFVEGPNKAKSEVFAQLPGACDNIRRSTSSDKETYWVAFASVRNSSNPSMLDRLSNVPLLRKFISRLSYLTGTVFEEIGDIVKLEVLKDFGYSIKTGMYFLQFLLSNYGMIVEVDVNGKIITAYSSPDGMTTNLSEVCEVKGKTSDERILLLGSYSNSYLGRLVVRK